MLRHPQHWTALSADPSLAGAITEETLRYDPPVQLVGRVAGADMTIGGVDVAQGDTMMLLLAAAHRDPAVTERPNVFDPADLRFATWPSDSVRTSVSVPPWPGWKRRWP